MMRPWKGKVRVTTREVLVLMSGLKEGDLLKARLPPRAQHPRALLTLLEGFALWQGKPMRAVLCAASADDGRPCFCDSGLFGDELWPGASPLVHDEVGGRDSRRRLLVGLGDFRPLRVETRGGEL